MRSGRYERCFGDLRRAVGESPAGAGSRVVHYCSADRLDREHAERLAGAPAVDLRAYAEGGHNVVKHLRDTGRLLAELLSPLPV